MEKETFEEFVLNEIEASEIDVKPYIVKDTLNPKIFNIETDQLKPEIRKTLLDNAKQFLKFLTLPDNLKIYDIVLTGSLANYNYNEFSDLDVHVIADYNDINQNKELLTDYFKVKKDAWADNFGTTVYDYPVELYIQDKNEAADWTATYSLLKNKWIQKPEKNKVNIDKKTITKKASDIINQIDELHKESETSTDEKLIDKFNKIKQKISKMREYGLKHGGELSTENLIFKVLRNTKTLEKMYEIKTNILRNKLTIK